MRFIIALVLVFAFSNAQAQYRFMSAYMNCEDVAGNQCVQTVSHKFCGQYNALPEEIKDAMDLESQCLNLQSQMNGESRNDLMLSNSMINRGCTKSQNSDEFRNKLVQKYSKHPEIAKAMTSLHADYTSEIKQCWK